MQVFFLLKSSLLKTVWIVAAGVLGMSQYHDAEQVGVVLNLPHSFQIRFFHYIYVDLSFFGLFHYKIMYVTWFHDFDVIMDTFQWRPMSSM